MIILHHDLNIAYRVKWVSEWLLFNANSAKLSATSSREQVNFQCDDDALY